MKAVLFPKPVQLLQVFCLKNRYGKDQKSFADRRDDLQWKPLLSRSGFVAGGQLHLPEAILANGSFPNCDMVTMEDYTGTEPPVYKRVKRTMDAAVNHCFNLHHGNRLDCFSIKHSPAELWLDYERHMMGDPDRDNFQLGYLEEGIAIEVRINGKTDSSSGRFFNEAYYIFQNLGSFDRYMLLDEKFAGVMKEVPLERKLVNLLKPLY
jgi:hypothetical protein